MAIDNSTPDTDELLLQVSAGHDGALNVLFDKHRLRLRRMIKSRMDQRLKRRIDPSDVIQETLIEASRLLPEYLVSRPVAFYPWLRQLAWNRLIDLHRTHLLTSKRSVFRENDALGFSSASGHLIRWASHLVSDELPPVDQLIQKELKNRVQQALQKLRKIDREILILRHVEQLGIEEVADVLRIPQGTVKSRHFRAIIRIRDFFENGATDSGSNHTEEPSGED